MGNTDKKDVVQENLENLETWLFQLDKYTSRGSRISSKLLNEIKNFMNIFYKKSPLFYFENSEFSEDMSIQIKNKLIKSNFKSYK